MANICNFVTERGYLTDCSLVCGIVAVPGLGAHAFGTWKSSNWYKMWLRDFLADRDAMEDTRILFYGYDSSIDNSTSSDSIDDYAKRILLLLSEARKQQQVIMIIPVCIRANLLLLVRKEGVLLSSSAIV
jgi:hypothetical protein